MNKHSHRFPVHPQSKSYWIASDAETGEAVRIRSEQDAYAYWQEWRDEVSIVEINEDEGRCNRVNEQFAEWADFVPALTGSRSMNAGRTM